MEKDEIKELLGKQLQMLSEKSKDCTASELAEMTEAMYKLAQCLIAFF